MFDGLGNEKERCSAISHCWSDDSIVYLGCKKGFLLSLDWESRKLTVVMDCSVHETQSSHGNLNIIQEGMSFNGQFLCMISNFCVNHIYSNSNGIGSIWWY